VYYTLNMNDLKAKDAVAALEKLGYKVKISKPSIKKTFEIEAELLESFMDLQKKSNIKVKDALHEALTDWIKKRRK
jgi:hypothetical protein